MPQQQTTRLSKANADTLNGERSVVVGKVLRTVGLKGFVRIRLETDYPERFAPGGEVYAKKPLGEAELLKVAESKGHSRRSCADVRFEGIESCDAALSLVGLTLVVPMSERHRLSDDTEFYTDELEGMRVIEPDGADAGSVVSLEEGVASPYLVVNTAKQKEVLIPFIKVFIASISRESRQVKLAKPISVHAQA